MNIEGLSRWPEKDTAERRASPFKSTWTKTLQLLQSELDKLSARNVTLSTMHSPENFRIDGKLRSDTRAPEHPGVVLTFEKFDGWNDELQQSQYIELRLPCDTFGYWKDNVRAVRECRRVQEARGSHAHRERGPEANRRSQRGVERGAAASQLPFLRSPPVGQ